MDKKLSEYTVVELKSLAYDQLTVIENAQANLRVLNQEIANRIQSFQEKLNQTDSSTNETEKVNI